MSRFTAPAPRYLGPPRHHGPATNKPIHLITLHSTVSPCQVGQARATAHYFQETDRDASAHYIVDPGEVIQATLDSVVAFHAPPNGGTLGVEMCDMPDAKSARRWRDKAHRQMFGRATRLVAELCLAYEVPPYYRSARALRQGKRGVTTHAQVSLAFGQTNHWDPGAWPRRAFMFAVRRHVKAIQKAATK